MRCLRLDTTGELWLTPPVMPLDLSIVVVSFKTPTLVRQCLRSVYDRAWRHSYEVLVVDNASGDGSAEMIASEFPQATLFANQENVGFARACNQATRASKGRYVILLNSDAEIRTDGLDKLIEFMDVHPDAGLTNPKLVYGDGTLQPQAIKLPDFWRDAVWHSVFWSTPIHRIFGRDYAKRALMPGRDYDKTIEVEWVRGAAMMIRRAVIDQIGLLDEAFFFGHEEIDYSIRTTNAGWKLYYVADAEVVHHGSRSQSLFGRAIGAKIYEGSFYFWEKYGGRSKVFVYRAVVSGVVTGTMLYRLAKLPLSRDRKAELAKYKNDFQVLHMSVAGAYPRGPR